METDTRRELVQHQWIDYGLVENLRGRLEHEQQGGGVTLRNAARCHRQLRDLRVACGKAR